MEITPTSRQEFANFARRYAGTSSSNRSDEYIDLLTRGSETPQMRRDMSKMSSCALFVRALWWCFGAEHDLFCAPYKMCAPLDVITIAKQRCAYRAGPTISATSSPNVGDAFYIATTEGKREHFGVITACLETQPGKVWKYETVEGGQGVGGTGIATLTRTFVKNGMWAVSGDRVLVAWFDFAALALPGLRLDWCDVGG